MATRLQLQMKCNFQEAAQSLYMEQADNQF
jgi:hypothetical protein